MLSKAGKEKLSDLLFTGEDDEPQREVFALLDGAMVRQLPDFLDDEEVEYAPLIPPPNEEPEEITRATYLAHVERDSPTVDWLTGPGWGAKWGIWISAPAGTELEDLLGHLRELAQVRLPDGRIVFFRFYDPRVWRAFFPTCDLPQHQHLFSLPVFYGCENSDGTALLTDKMIDGTPHRDEHALETAPAAEA
ncbi:DUF4123 domain-containing protein [Prosthecobacter sp.]|uniref:DUF4123 domain-containing protein n=1 Tax=Prosthecobacter sp. TaxID=1965333 RepID=UPI00378304CD